MKPGLLLLLLAAPAAAHPAYDIAIDRDGTVFFLDWPRKRVMRVSKKGELAVAADLASAAKGTDPHTIALDAEGRLLVGASYQPRIWRVTGKGAVAEFDLAPWKKALAGDSVLNLAWTDRGLYLLVAEEKRGRFRLLDPDKRTLLDVTRGKIGYLNLYGGSFLVAKGGTVYLTADERVWRMAPGRKPVALAGSAEAGHRDGKGTDARFSSPYGMCFAKDGALLVADEKNGRIRRIDAEGRVTTLPPRLHGPHAIGLGPEGRLHVAEYDHAVIRIKRIEKKKVVTLATVETR